MVLDLRRQPKASGQSSDPFVELELDLLTPNIIIKLMTILWFLLHIIMLTLYVFNQNEQDTVQYYTSHKIVPFVWLVKVI